jgi:predicted TPR repeat methyltransferase
MSDNFDDVLVGTLEYKTPQRIFDAVKAALPDSTPKQSILDLGCGTGLCGPVFHTLAEFMAGVDLSPKMVAKARERDLYDLLVTGELTKTMNDSDRKYNLVLSADVFVYIGELAEVFESCFDVLEPGGLFAFSNEAVTDEKQDYVLNKSGRYAHSRDYIEELAQRLNFNVVSYDQSVIRKEGGNPVDGMIFVLKKPE